MLHLSLPIQNIDREGLLKNPQPNTNKVLENRNPNLINVLPSTKYKQGLGEQEP